MFYIGSPKDLVVAKERDWDDRIEWLMKRERYEEALKHVREAQAFGGSKKFTVTGVGQKYLGWLLEQGKLCRPSIAPAGHSFEQSSRLF